MQNWYKFVCNNEGNIAWMVNELKDGRLRYGWSPPGSNLIKLAGMTWEDREKLTIGNDDWSESGNYIYSQSKFLLHRIKPNDLVVIQLTQPIEDFYICKVTGEYEYAENENYDFNHVLPCELFNTNPIPIYSRIVSNSLRHALTKRGKYYGIYPEDAIRELNEIVNNKSWLNEDLKEITDHEYEMFNTGNKLIQDTIRLIQNNWQSKYFESIAKEIFESIEHIEVKQDWDSGKGWDLLLTMRDPLTDEILMDDIPVQCKNYRGDVDTEKPFDDMRRCFENIEGVSIGYIAIIGDLTDNFRKMHRDKEKEISAAVNREISIRLIDQEQIAKLYLRMYAL
jgi:hypothetical protein